MSTKNILVTGMSGLIGSAVRNRLESKYTLRALNRRHVSGLECYQADIANLEEIQPAFDKQDVVVHLAAVADGGATWGDPLTDLYDINDPESWKPYAQYSMTSEQDSLHCTFSNDYHGECVNYPNISQ